MSCINCDLCNKGTLHDVIVISRPDRFEQKLGIGEQEHLRSWAKCDSCSVFKNVMAKKNEDLLSSIADKYYEIDFGDNPYLRFKKIIELKPVDSDNYSRVNRISRFLDQWYTNEQKLEILDIGSGLGVFPFAFKILNSQRISNLVCIEPDPIAAAHLRSLGEFQVDEAIFEQGSKHQEKDFISLNKVLEHVSDPLKMLADIKKSLKKTGVLYVEVPHSATTVLRESSDNILGSLHKYLFDNVSLTYVLTSVGFDVLECTTLVEPSGKITCYAFATPSLEIFCKSLRK